MADKQPNRKSREHALFQLQSLILSFNAWYDWAADHDPAATRLMIGACQRLHDELLAEERSRQQEKPPSQ